MAAAATLSMASMLSVVTGAFSSNAASSTLSDSDDEYQSQTEQENGNESQNEEAEPTPQGNPWDAPNLNRLREPRREKERVKPKFDHFSEGAIRDEIEIEFNTKNGKSLRVQSPLWRSNTAYSLTNCAFQTTQTSMESALDSKENSSQQSN